MDQEPRQIIEIIETRAIFIEHKLCGIMNLPILKIMEGNINDKKERQQSWRIFKEEIIAISHENNISLKYDWLQRQSEAFKI